MTINIEATIRWKGYDPNDLKPNSSKRVWANCDDCDKGRWVPMGGYCDLCRSCSQKGKRNHSFGRKHSPEHIAKIAISVTDYYSNQSNCDVLSASRKRYLINNPEAQKNLYIDNPELRDKMSNAIKNSDAHKAAIENMIGGEDLVWHHIAYDFGNPDALRIRIIRKFHGRIHKPKGCQVGTYGYSLID